MPADVECRRAGDICRAIRRFSLSLSMKQTQMASVRGGRGRRQMDEGVGVVDGRVAGIPHVGPFRAPGLMRASTQGHWAGWRMVGAPTLRGHPRGLRVR